MKAALLLLLLLCVSAEADDLRYEVTALFQQLKSQLEADMASKMGEFQTSLNENFALVKNDLANLTARFNQFESRTNPLIEEDRKKREEDRKRRLCESYGFTWDGGVRMCYFLSRPAESKSWAESKLYCLERQADLIIMNSQEKQDFVVRVVPSGTNVWIGLSDRHTEGSFKWVDGKPLSSPTFWYPGQPDDTKGDQDCVFYVNSGGSNIGWVDTTCSSSLRWMCERVVQ